MSEGVAPALRIALADDQALVRAGLRALLEQQGLQIAFEAEGGPEPSGAGRSLPP